MVRKGRRRRPHRVHDEGSRDPDLGDEAVRRCASAALITGFLALLALTVGSGFEYATDSEQSEYGYPFLIDYGFSDKLKVTIEPSYVFLKSKAGGSVSGLGDLETTVESELVKERRYRPALTLEGIVKWPTARHAELGTGERDYTVGLLLDKEFVGWDADFNATYTFVGSPPGAHLQNTIEVALASEWHLTRTLSIVGEVVTTHGSGVFRGQPGSISGIGGLPRVASEPFGNESEGTLGLAERLNHHLKLEEGGILKTDGSWQAVFGWEWDFGEGD